MQTEATKIKGTHVSPNPKWYNNDKRKQQNSMLYRQTDFNFKSVHFEQFTFSLSCLYTGILFSLDRSFDLTSRISVFLRLYAHTRLKIFMHTFEMQFYMYMYMQCFRYENRAYTCRVLAEAKPKRQKIEFKLTFCKIQPFYEVRIYRFLYRYIFINYSIVECEIEFYLLSFLMIVLLGASLRNGIFCYLIIW